MVSLLDIEISVRQRILEYAVLVDQTFKPYYPYCSSFAREREVQKENYGIPLILANRQLRKETSQVFYGSSRFLFERPSLALWWLSHIGAFNRANIRSIGLHLSSRVGAMASLLDETLWIRALVQIRSEIQLKFLHVDFHNWRDDSYQFLQQDNRHSLLAKRDRLRSVFIMEMSKFRELRLEIWNNGLMSHRDIDTIHYQVSLPIGQEYDSEVYHFERPIQLNLYQTFESQDTPLKSTEMIAVDRVSDNFVDDRPIEPLARTSSHIEVIDLVDIENSHSATYFQSNFKITRANRLSFNAARQNEQRVFRQDQEMFNLNDTTQKRLSKAFRARRMKRIAASEAQVRGLGWDTADLLEGHAVAPTYGPGRPESEINESNDLDVLLETPWPEEEDPLTPSRPVFR